jgi:hypothetical protein
VGWRKTIRHRVLFDSTQDPTSRLGESVCWIPPRLARKGVRVLGTPFNEKAPVCHLVCWLLAATMIQGCFRVVVFRA